MSLTQTRKKRGREGRRVGGGGARIETTEGVDLNLYNACLLGGDSNLICTGYTPQPAALYGY